MIAKAFLAVLATLRFTHCHFNLLNAIANGNEKEVKRLLNEEDDCYTCINARDDRGNTPLLLALQDDMEDVAIELIRKGASLELTNNKGDAPLHSSVKWRKPRIVQALIRERAPLEQRNADDCTALHLILLTNRIIRKVEKDILRMLLNAGANVEQAMETIRPLHFTSIYADPYTADLLLAKRADPNAIWEGKCAVSYTPLEIILANKKDEAPPVTNPYEHFDRNDNNYDKTKKRGCVVAYLQHGSDLSTDQARNILRRFYFTTYVDIQKTYDGFDEYVLKNTRAHLWKFNVALPYNDARATVQAYDNEGSFALYRLLNSCYNPKLHGTRISKMDAKKFDVFDHVVQEIMKRTYMENVPPEIMSDVLYEAGHYGWKIERLAWNVALAVQNLNMDAKRTLIMAYDIFMHDESNTTI